MVYSELLLPPVTPQRWNNLDPITPPQRTYCTKVVSVCLLDSERIWLREDVSYCVMKDKSFNMFLYSVLICISRFRRRQMDRWFQTGTKRGGRETCWGRERERDRDGERGVNAQKNNLPGLWSSRFRQVDGEQKPKRVTAPCNLH